MIFARYKGIGDNFTAGRLYLAAPEMDESEMVGFGFLMIDDDSGEAVRVSPEDDSFEYLEEVYAVVVCPVANEDWEPGEVVVVTDAVEDGQMALLEPQGHLLRVKAVGLFSASNFVILDRTNIFPGLVVRDTDGTWVTVRRVDECLWMMANGTPDYRSPEDFRFAVSGGDILTEPVVKCVMATGEEYLTQDKFYRLARTRDGDTVDVCDDSGKVREFMASRFKMGD